MPVRLTCPSCSATLSIRDEFASRAVKCPKCAGIIPPQPSAPETVSEPEALATVPPPPPPPEPEPAPQPAPAAKAERDRDEDDDRPRTRRDEDDDRPRKRRDDDEDDRPRRRRDDDDEDDRPRRRRDEEDDRDDRPRKRRRDEDDDRPRRRRRDEDDDDGRPVVKPRYTPKGSNAGLIFAGVALVVCLGAVGAGIFAYTQNEKANREAEATNAAAAKEKEAAAAFLASFDRVKIADPRRSADAALGNGRVATVDDLAKVFRNSSDGKKVSDWSPKVKDGRVLFWQSEESFALVALHPDADGRVMAKSLRAKNASVDVGDLNDAAFLRRYPSAKGEPPPRGEPPPKGKMLDPDGE